jgi:hypothetical protein
MNKLELAKTAISKTLGRTGLVMQKHSPEILIGMGIAGFVTTTFLACKATIRAQSVMDTHKKNIAMIKEYKSEKDAGVVFENDPEPYTDKEYKQELFVTRIQTGARLTKLYGPAVVLGVASIGCVLGAHKIMNKRQVAIMAAYKLMEEGFNKYRQRVIEEHGEEADKMYKNGTHKETVIDIEKDETGKAKKTKSEVEVVDPNKISVYAKFFDESCRQWSKTPEYNLLFIKNTQNHLNDLLHARGHVFLNEAYEALGLPHSQAGAVVGWILTKDGSTDNFIDFGIFDLNNPATRDFVNGYERTILLDFNVDGVIYDKI